MRVAVAVASAAMLRSNIRIPLLVCARPKSGSGPEAELSLSHFRQDRTVTPMIAHLWRRGIGFGSCPRANECPLGVSTRRFRDVRDRSAYPPIANQAAVPIGSASGQKRASRRYRACWEKLGLLPSTDQELVRYLSAA